MEKHFLLKTYVDGGIGDTPFPNSEDQVEIGSFRYDAKRMGGAPTITATVLHNSCLDDLWTEMVYGDFNGERFFLKQTPTSSYSSADSRYKHELTLVSERSILDNVYFYDTVVGEPKENDAPVSNSTKVNFFGDIHEFAKRLGYSLDYSGIPYRVVVDSGIQSDDKLVSFEDEFFSNAIQASYNTYDIPYYFKRNKEDGVMEIHFGYTDSVIPQVFEYGVDNALLSITKTNSNNKIVNRVSARGSSENIPFYYPNESAKGEIDIHVSGSISEDDVQIRDMEEFDNLHVNQIYTFKGDSSLNTISESVYIPYKEESISFEEGEATINKLYIENGGTDLQIRYNVNFNSDTKQKIEINWVLENIFNPVLTMANHLKPAQGKDHIELEVYEVNIISDGINKRIDFEPVFEKHEFYSVMSGSSGSAKYGTLSNKLRQTGVKIDIEDIRGEAVIIVYARFKKLGNFWALVPDYMWGSSDIKKPYSDIVFSSKVTTMTVGGWRDSDNNSYNMKNYGIVFLKEPQYGDTISYSIVKYVNTSENLMPSIYRATDGSQRFYNAVNYPFPYTDGYELKFGEYVSEEDGLVHNDSYKQQDGTYYHFPNEFVEGKPKEHIFDVEDLKPTIKGATNDVYWVEEDENGQFGKVYQRIDMFADIAYDEPDNDETYEDEKDNANVKYKHSYFFAKLRKLPFNLFDHAIEDQPMTISFTSGHAGACNFKIAVSEEYPHKNTVQVNADGTLKRDEEGRVECGVHGGVEFQPIQQDTTQAEVWIALMKEDETYGILMPKATIYETDTDGSFIYDEDGNPVVKEAGHRPIPCSDSEKNDGDTFVITGIHLPKEYITFAEDKLEAEIIKYINDNNEEKFKFSIDFSRIFFEENEQVLQLLDENSRIRVSYNGKIYLLYVNSYSYSMSEGDALPQIKVELDEELSISQNALQRAINSVKSEIGDAISNVDVLALSTPFFLRKDTDDEANGKIDFKKGIKFGEGGKVEILDNNSAKLTIDYLEVTKKATFTALEIQEKTHIGGQILLTPAAMNCGEVEELDDCYRCYFQTMGENGEEIFNQFSINDLAICQTYNTWGSRYYWRQVVGIGEDYIDLSKTLCDEESDIPMAGDKIIQLGNKTNKARQAAQVLSSYGTDAPSFIMYNGIDDFTLADKNVTGIIWNPETLEPQMYSYGSFFFGDRELKENYITYQQRDGEAEKKLHINADVTFGANSEGLSNLEEFKSVQESVAKLNRTVQEVQDQVDGVIENWSGDYNPTLNNYPVSKWEELGNSALIAHINDTFINISDGEDSGKAWRWCECFDISSLMGSSIIYSDIIPSRNWFKIGTLDKAHRYSSAGGAGFSTVIKYDTDILIKEGLYIRIEKDTMDVYVLDELGYYEESPFDIIFYYADFIQVQTDDGTYLLLHWHPISNTDDLVALKEAAEAKAKVNDLMFLSETFKKGETNIDGGLVMTGMVAVKNEDENIEAFLNGSDFAESEDSGKLILAGGIPATSKSGSVDLEDRAKEAKIKMYEDGDFVMKGGGISVERGNIGPFYIGGTHTLASNEKSPLQDTKVILDTTSMAVVSEDKEDNSDISISIGSKISSTYGALYDADGNSLFSINHSTIRGIKIEANDDGDDIRGVLEIKRGGSGSKCAIAIDRGYISGLRPRMRIVKSSGTLSNLDHSIMISNSSSLTINLPSNAEVGQVIEIYLPYPNSTTLKHRILGNGLGIQCPHNDTWNNSYFDILAYGVVKFICMADGNGDLHWWFYRIA